MKSYCSNTIDVDRWEVYRSFNLPPSCRIRTGFAL
jgi:hypothetical protein